MPEYLVTFANGDRRRFHANSRDSAEKMARRYSRENLRDTRFSHGKEEVKPNIRSIAIRREGRDIPLE